MKKQDLAAPAFLIVLLGAPGAVAAEEGIASGLPTRAIATFAGGCFWCMQPPFDRLEGVIKTTVGYTGGSKLNPTYEEVSAGGTGHAEAIQIEYDPTRVSYEKLLDVFWHNVDPTSKDRQFCDVGHQYRTAIFYQDEAQRQAAGRSRERLEKRKPFAGPIVTEIVPAGSFYPAEEYHQSYSKKNPIHYKYYRWGCGRDRRLEDLWGKDAGEPEGATGGPGTSLDSRAPTR